MWLKDFKEIGLDSLDKGLDIVKKHIEAYPHQPKKAYALTLEEIDTKVSLPFKST